MSDDTIRLYDVFNGVPHRARRRGPDPDWAQGVRRQPRGHWKPSRTICWTSARKPTGAPERRRAEDRDLPAGLRAGPRSRPTFRASTDMEHGSSAHSAIGEVMSQWLNKSEVPPPAVDGSIAEPARDVGFSDLSSIGAFGSLVPDVIAGMRRGRQGPASARNGRRVRGRRPRPAPHRRAPRATLSSDRAWGRLPVTVAAGGGACGETIRMVYEGLCGLTALIEWSEGDRVVRTTPMLIETFVQLDDLYYPVLVGMRCSTKTTSPPAQRSS